MPRTHHYVYGHIALREIFFENPAELVAGLTIDQGDEFLATMWEVVGQLVEQREGKSARLPSTGLTHEARIFGPKMFGVIVTLPQPKEVTEAYFVALVVTKHYETPFRFITLEYGDDLYGGKHTVLCEWEHDNHVNYGPGPEATLDAFAAHIEKKFGT